MEQMSLWGEEFTVKEDDLNRILSKTKSKQIENLSTEKKLSSKYVSIYDKINLIKENVYQKLGHFANDTRVIRSYDEYKKYIDKAIENGIIAIDTETNNTIDVFGDCKLMGLCLYTPGMKQVYIPVNHRHFTTTYDERGNEQIVMGELLENQLTEAQIAEQLIRLDKTFNIFHNAIFDIEVLQQTVGVRVHVDWDTQVGAAVLDENELKALKTQYRLHIDPTQEKYDIEHLFEGFSYAIFDPELFALYAASDAGITYKLYLWQKEQLEKPDLKDVYKLFKEIEIPILDVVVDMESRGIEVNKEYASKMSKIYHAKSDAVQEKINKELEVLLPTIEEWKLTPQANERQKVYLGKKSKLTEDKIVVQYPYTDAKGKRYKWSSKTPAEQLSNPIDLDSGTQLAILLYDIMKVPVVKKDEPRGTGKEILDQLADEEHIHLCELIKEKRAVDILIDTFIDAIPQVAKEDNKVHAKFRTVGTKTLRFSSDSPNMQNIPSHDKTVRMIFKPSLNERNIEINGNLYTIKDTEEVYTDKGWKLANKLTIGDKLQNSENKFDIIKTIQKQDNYYVIEV